MNANKESNWHSRTVEKVKKYIFLWSIHRKMNACYTCSILILPFSSKSKSERKRTYRRAGKSVPSEESFHGLWSREVLLPFGLSLNFVNRFFKSFHRRRFICITHLLSAVIFFAWGGICWMYVGLYLGLKYICFICICISTRSVSFNITCSKMKKKLSWYSYRRFLVLIKSRCV